MAARHWKADTAVQNPQIISGSRHACASLEKMTRKRSRGLVPRGLLRCWTCGSAEAISDAFESEPAVDLPPAPTSAAAADAREANPQLEELQTPSYGTDQGRGASLPVPAEPSESAVARAAPTAASEDNPSRPAASAAEGAADELQSRSNGPIAPSGINSSTSAVPSYLWGSAAILVTNGSLGPDASAVPSASTDISQQIVNLPAINTRRPPVVQRKQKQHVAPLADATAAADADANMASRAAAAAASAAAARDAMLITQSAPVNFASGPFSGAYTQGMHALDDFSFPVLSSVPHQPTKAASFTTSTVARRISISSFTSDNMLDDVPLHLRPIRTPRFHCADPAPPSPKAFRSASHVTRSSRHDVIASLVNRQRFSGSFEVGRPTTDAWQPELPGSNHRAAAPAAVAGMPQGSQHSTGSSSCIGTGADQDPAIASDYFVPSDWGHGSTGALQQLSSSSSGVGAPAAAAVGPGGDPGRIPSGQQQLPQQLGRSMPAVRKVGSEGMFAATGGEFSVGTGSARSSTGSCSHDVAGVSGDPDVQQLNSDAVAAQLASAVRLLEQSSQYVPQASATHSQHSHLGSSMAGADSPMASDTGAAHSHQHEHLASGHSQSSPSRHGRRLYQQQTQHHHSHQQQQSGSAGVPAAALSSSGAGLPATPRHSAVATLQGLSSAQGSLNSTPVHVREVPAGTLQQQQQQHSGARLSFDPELKPEQGVTGVNYARAQRRWCPVDLPAQDQDPDPEPIHHSSKLSFDAQALATDGVAGMVYARAARRPAPAPDAGVSPTGSMGAYSGSHLSSSVGSARSSSGAHQLRGDNVVKASQRLQYGQDTSGEGVAVMKQRVAI